MEGTQGGFRFRPLREEDARAIAGWRYDERQSLDDSRDLDRLLSVPSQYFAALSDEGDIVGFCCFGEEARVAGMAAEPEVLDLAGSLRPNLTGIGLGGGFLRAVCELGRELYAPRAFRLAIPAFHLRAQRVAHALGFERVDLHATAERDYVLMERADVAPRPRARSPSGAS